MKKLVTAACALVAASAFAVTSANTVGYQDKEVEDEGFTAITPTFTKIGGAAATLGDLCGTFIEGESIQVTDTDFATDAEYFYFVSGSLAPGATGWYCDDGETPANNLPIPAGGSILYQSQGTETVTFAGEVSGVDVVVNAEEVGFTAVGNPFPVDTTLASITFSGLTEGDSIQFIDNEAGTAEEYFYFVAGSLAPGATGWYCDDGETPAGTTEVSAGAGFLYQNAGEASGVTISFAAPALN